MTFSLTVDTERWRANLARVTAGISEAGGSVVPVVKGNGYGLGNAALALESTLLGVEAIAVGTVHEAAEAATAFSGDVVVLEPADPRDSIASEEWAALDASPLGPRLVRTLASESGWHAAVEAARQHQRPIRAVVEGLTSMQRFGLDEAAVARLVADRRLTESLTLEGLALHLPLVQPATPRTSSMAMLRDSGSGIVESGTARAREVIAWSRLWTTLVADHLGTDAPDTAATLWVSHLDDGELASVRAAVPDLPMRARIGTRLWHGDRSSLQARGTVLEVHRTSAPVGYRQRRPPKDGTVLVVSGGTSHGVALEAPSSIQSMRARARAAGSGALEAAGRARSPFRLGSESLWFVEPPHVSVSMLRVPRGVVPPAIGDELDCEVRYTTTRADMVLWR